ncbi:MAG TPA: glycosyltransferase family A protein, partial [Streptosporangiaceae bacterium]|nr:glycosyltransferase family A protein [Streptosporangiaceae bacterium]
MVVPTVGRPCLRDCLAALDSAAGPAPEQVVIVDDRPARPGPLDIDPGPSALPLHVVSSGGVGPAAARNAGWRVTSTPWVAFLDDDVRVSGDWRSRLAEDLAGL